MKKRVLATVLALATVLSVLFCFTSCGEEKTLESIEFYDGLPEADKNNCEFLSTKVPFPASPIQPGEYVLIVLITTRNYKGIICTTQFTVIE